jgi:hypothetical protein
MRCLYLDWCMLGTLHHEGEGRSGDESADYEKDIHADDTKNWKKD